LICSFEVRPGRHELRSSVSNITRDTGTTEDVTREAGCHRRTPQRGRANGPAVRGAPGHQGATEIPRGAGQVGEEAA